MKKILLFSLILVLAFAFVACGDDASDDITTNDVDNSTAPVCEHDWMNADCDTPKTCRKCKATEGTPLPHAWVDADCLTPKTCSVCGITEGNHLGHSTDAEGDRAATCTEKAYCSRCEKEYGEPLGHSTTAEGDRAATCTDKAYCSVCQSEYGEPLGHSTTAEGDRAATCTDKAYCSVCQSEYGEALGHSTTAEGDRAATCTEKAYCSVCQSEYGEALGHSTDAEGDRAATCVSKAYCSRCECEYGEIDPNAHDMVIDAAVDPTCTEDGKTEGSHCSRCDAATTAQTVVPALGHSTDKEGDRAATCVSKAYCSRCECEYGEIDPNAHDMVIDEAVDPTCTEDGKTEGSHCSRCDAATTAQEVIPALGHSTDKEGDRAATCVSKAYCSVCECEYGEIDPDAHELLEATCLLPVRCKNCEYAEGKALGHDFTGELHKDDAGHWNVCANGCGATNKTEHTYGDWEITKDPTADEPGNKTKSCICGHSVTVDILAPSTEASPEVTTPEVTGSDFTLATNNKAEYIIISKADAYDELAQTLATLLTQKTGITFTYKEVEPTTGNKIYVGFSPKSLMTDYNRLTYSGYVFRANGSNIHITGWTKTAIQSAITAFADLAAKTEYWTMGGADFSLITIKMPGSILKTYNPESYPNRDANLLGKHISNYVIVLPKNYSVNERFMAEALIDQIGKETGWKLEWIAENITNSNTYKIVCGETTTYATSATLYEGLAQGSYHIKSEGNLVYVAYDNYLVATDACKALCEMYKTEPGSALDKVGIPNYSQKLIQKKDSSYIRIMTTNIVAPGDSGGQEMELRYGITWKNRIQMQGEAIMLYLPDFVGFQELQQGKVNGVTAATHTEILKTIGDEYTMVYYDGLAKTSHWTPIAYRHTVWQVEDKAYGGVMDGDMHRWQWALFSKIDDPDTKYIVMNLHYPTSKNPAERELAGIAVNAEFKRIKELYPDVPVSITGDFNAEYATDLFNLTVDGTDLKTGYMATSDYGTGRATIDHVLIENDDVTVHNYRMINEGNLYMTSDHKPVFVDVSIGKILLPTPGPDISWGDGTDVTPTP